MSTKVISLCDKAGVICLKETGEMKTDADCRGCPHFGACWDALMEELGANESNI